MTYRSACVGCFVACFVVLAGFNVAVAQKDDQQKDHKHDMKFAEKAAMSGMAEVKLGQLALEKASSPEVKQFAQKMIDDHGKANDELKSLAQSKQMELPTDLGKHQKDYDKLAAMSGSDFDRAYVDCMVKDHKEDVSLFEKQANKGEDAELKAFAARTLPTLQMHLQHAQDLQKAMKG